jgi:hypothetical protein
MNTPYESFLDPLFLVPMGIGLISIAVVGVMYFHFRRKFAPQLRDKKKAP